MTIQRHPIGFAGQLDLRGSAQGLHLIHAAGRAMQVQLPAAWISVWMPLAGTLTLESQDTTWSLPSRQLQIWRDGALRGSARVPGWWIGLCGPVDSWKPHLSAAQAGSVADLFPAECACPTELRRLLVRLARITRSQLRPCADTTAMLDTLCSTLIGNQVDLQLRLQRCSGRTQLRRQQTLLRLLRVRQHIERHDDGRLELAQLARIANYSPCHLIRMHREVFDETPSEYATRLRFDRALKLVRETRMPVCEITEVLGFESQSAFCRAFKSAYGATATQVRELGALQIACLPLQHYQPTSYAA
ncbi:MAG TPA: AraC family transcriptional regulator [Pseudoxanthomonas sp.]|nr:AraC family transcriptional regulator [Pseudoxanthomonas sp.]